MISRRRFVAGVGLGVLWGACGEGVVGWASAGAAQARRTPSPPPLNLLTVTADTFRKHVGSQFRLQRAGQRPLALTLARVEVLAAGSDRTNSFSLLFQAAAPLGLAQRTYPLEHGVLGRFAVFLVPVGPRRAEVVFNHIVPPTTRPVARAA